MSKYRMNFYVEQLEGAARAALKPLAEACDEAVTQTERTRRADVHADLENALVSFEQNYKTDLPGGRNGWRCPECGSHTKYQGWTNHASWATALHLANDQELYNATIALVRDAGSVRKGGEALREFVERHFERHIPGLYPRRFGMTPWYSLLAHDLLELDFVDWFEVAEYFKPEAWGTANEAPGATSEASEEGGAE